MTSNSPQVERQVDALALARACRAAILERYIVTSCIETAFLFERTAYHLGLPASRMVCQAIAFSPLMAEALLRGDDPREVLTRPGHWSVGVGSLQEPEDFVGRFEPAKNRFVGHVVCLAGDRLVDPSADQMSRPERGLVVDRPIIARWQEDGMAYAKTAGGVLLRYTAHPDVPVPRPKTDRILERMAKKLAGELLR